MSAVKFVVSHLDEQLGPFTEVELKAKWQRGELLPIDYVYDELKQDWVLLSERFAWGSTKNDPPAPPPVTEVTVKRKRPTEAMMNAPAVPSSVPQNSQPKIALQKIAPSTAMAPGAVATKPVVSTATPQQGADVHLVGGIGEVDLSSLQPGNVELALNQANGLKLATPLKIQVHAAEPATLRWRVPERQTAGHDAEITVSAHDKGGHLCKHFSEKFAIRVGGSDSHEISVEMVNGEASLQIQHTKAEAWPLSLHYFGSLQIQMPESKVLLWEPGPATHLVLDGPQEYTTGQPLKIKVKAVDAFGNLANSFQGTITLEIKAS